MIPFFLAQIQPVEPTVVNQSGQEFVIDAGILSEDGKNIFHTFEQFGLTQEQIVNFLANPETENIFNRVIGNDPSFIDGLIKITGGNPDFYFLNSNGIIFGQRAQINVPAAFYASTATSLQFGNDGFPLYAGEEWFSTPFAIGDGIESVNGDPTFLIFGGGLSNPILNLGTIQAEKIDLSGGLVVSLGELQSEDIRFSVGFNPVPWKVATDTNYWMIVPRSAFSSVYPSLDLKVEEDLESKDIFIFFDSVARRLFVDTLTFEPVSFSSLIFGLGDTVSNQQVEIFRLGSFGEDFFIDLNFAIQPELPDDPVDDDPVTELPDDPVTELPDDPVTELPDDSVIEPPDDSVVDMPDDPVTELPDDPVVDISDDLVIELPDDPVTESPDDLVDSVQIESVTLGFTTPDFLKTERINFILPSDICYYPRLIQDDHRCLLRLDVQNQDYPEMTEEQFYQLGNMQ